jgi:YrbI family 3-deoxy-D-manno-octulosonate 8-phosphate phosphatase
VSYVSEACAKITIMLTDVDGVLTDGRLQFDNHGIESKQFHIRDGLGIRLWQRAGHRFGIVTGRKSEIVERRAAELDVDIVRQGDDDKLGQTEQIARELGVELEAICYIGDDLPDLPAIRAVGLGVAVQDAAAEVRAAANHVTRTAGGQGALREIIETILRSTGRWDDIVSRYAT